MKRRAALQPLAKKKRFTLAKQSRVWTRQNIHISLLAALPSTSRHLLKASVDLKVKIIHRFLLKAAIIALSLNLYICMGLSSKYADGRRGGEQR